MFWGLIMEPQKRYSQVVRKAFHISMASLDISNSDDQPAQVLCGYEGKNYLLCTLQKPEKLQCNLDLYFEEGRTVSFASNGKSLIHLTGYLTKDELDNSSDEDIEFEVKSKKKARSEDSAANESAPTKKLKIDHLLEECEGEDSDDSDFNIEQLMDEEVSEEESADEDDVEDLLEGIEEEDEDDEEAGEEGSDEDDSDDDEEEEEEVEEEKVVQNGLTKKSKKAKKGEEQTTPTKKNKQNKEKAHQLTPGPKTKKQEKTNGEEKNSKGKEEKKVKENQSPIPKKKTLSNGIIIEDLKIGQGDAATSGNFIQVYYEGRLKKNNKVFDKSLNGPGFGFRLGRGEVIKGWDIGVNGMKAGGKRRIICPPQAAYGAKGSPPVIPPNSTLVFEVEVKKVKK